MLHMSQTRGVFLRAPMPNTSLTRGSLHAGLPAQDGETQGKNKQQRLVLPSVQRPYTWGSVLGPLCGQPVGY